MLSVEVSGIPEMEGSGYERKALEPLPTTAVF